MTGPGRGPSRAPATPAGTADLADPARAWALAQALSPRPRLRVADVDANGRALNQYSREAALTGVWPDRPYAVYLADATGAYSLLGFDLDPHRGPVGEDLTDLRGLLDRAGLAAHVVCASGPRGGRHVWVALAEPASADVVDAVARALAARLPSLDVGALVNPSTGCLRPPGAPHRLVGASRVLEGAVSALLAPQAGPDQLQTLLALLDAPPARRPASEPRITARDTEGAPYLPGKRAALPPGSLAALHTSLPPDADASAVLWTVLVGAARAHWQLSDLAVLLPRAPGLEHARTVRSGAQRAARSPVTAQRTLARQWARAVDHAASTPPALGDDPTFEPRAAAVTAAVTAAQGRADAAPGRWARQGGPTDRRVLDAACDQMLAAVRLDVELDVRRLGLLCGISRETARRALQRLAADDWLALADPASGVRAARWRLPEVTVVTSTGSAVKGVSQADPRPAGAGPLRSAWRHALRRRRLDTAHDVFTPTPGLGHHAARVYASLAARPHARHELADRLGYPSARLDAYLDRLAEAGLVRLGLGVGWRQLDVDREEVAARLGAQGVLADRARRYQLEREAWAWWLDELAWMRLPHEIKRRRKDPPPGQTVLPLTGLVPRQRYGPHPRRPGGRADYAAALAGLRTTAEPVTLAA